MLSIITGVLTVEIMFYMPYGTSLKIKWKLFSPSWTHFLPLREFQFFLFLFVFKSPTNYLKWLLIAVISLWYHNYFSVLAILIDNCAERVKMLSAVFIIIDTINTHFSKAGQHYCKKISYICKGFIFAILCNSNSEFCTSQIRLVTLIT